MSLITPDFGLFFWMAVVFLVVLGILWKFGFPVIVKMVNERKEYIDSSLQKPMRLQKNLPTYKKRVKHCCRKHVRSRLRY